MSSARLRSIDFLRGVAALSVVVHHAVSAGGRPPEGTAWFAAVEAVSELGRMGVPLFFVLSGYCIHARWAQRKADGQTPDVPFVPFWKRRFFRLYPPYFVALVVSMGLVLLEYWKAPGLPLVQAYPEPKLRWMGLDFLAHVTMLHGLHPVFDRAGGNAPFWTLAREEYFYLLYFPLLAARRKWGLAPTAVAIALLSVSFPFLLRPWVPPGHAWSGVVVSSAIALWIQWVLGMVAVESAMGLAKWPETFFRPGIAMLAAASAYAAHLWAEPIAPLLWGLFFFAVLGWVVRLEQSKRWPAWRVVAWFERAGLYSYSIYLVHHPVRGVLKFFLGPLVKSANPLLYAVGIGVIVAAGYGVGRLFFWFVERHFLSLGKPQTAAPA
ncbi:MAG: acyltransferase family protein [Myxococcaceae bacterium]